MLYIYGGRSCQKLSKNISIENDSLNIIFSIVSDDRLPFNLSLLMDHLHEDKFKNYKIHILGDLIRLPLTQWRVRQYLIEELSILVSKKNITLYWYDGDKISEGYDFFMHHPLHSDKLSYVDYRSNDSLVKEFTCHTQEINFLSGRGYPQNSLLNKSKKEIDYIFCTIADLPNVERITCPFIDGLRINRLPRSLKKLDVRGCPNLRIDYKCIPFELEKINLSACDLFDIPDYIDDLKQLKTLLLYKNKLEISGGFKNNTNLEFLSLYRNKIKSIALDVIKLNKVNLGANPINSISINSTAENIVLGLRKVDIEKIILIHNAKLTLEF